MTNILYDLNLNHWQAILLSVLPALLNLFIFFYVRLYFTANQTSRIFSLLLLALVVFQISDTLVRMSDKVETAIAWNSILGFGPLFMATFGLQFCLLYTGRKKYADSFSIQFLLYGTSFVLFLLTLLNKDSYSFSSSEFWGWVYKINPGGYGAIAGYWIGLTGISMLALLIHYIIKHKENKEKREQATIIVIGISIPFFQGALTEIILPALGHPSIPLATTLLTCFSAGILFALKKYNLFSITDTLKMRTVLAAITDILIVLSPDKKILFINREGEEALGIDQSKKTDLKIEDFFTHKNSDSRNFHENLFAPVVAGKKIQNYSTELITKSGQRIPVVISATSYKVGMRESQVLLLIHNVSDVIRTEQELAVREQEVKDKSEELNTFFYRTTHDLKGPVASIVGLTTLAKREPNPEMTAMCLEKIENSASRLNAILLDFIKVMEVKERTPESILIDFRKMTDGIIHSVKYTTEQDVVDFKISILPDVHFHCDENLVDSILYNLIANAVNYRAHHDNENSFVHVQIYNFGNGIMMKVSDNGIGMKKEIQNKIFNLFFRAKKDSKGTGLGLYILKNAVSKLNGRVELESEVNKGTTFTVYLPALQSSDKIELQQFSTAS